MKNFLTILGFVFCLSVFTSCSVDDVEEYEVPVSQLKTLDKNSADVANVNTPDVGNSGNSGNSENSDDSDSQGDSDDSGCNAPIDPIKVPVKP